jgi:hypothetical protein
MAAPQQLTFCVSGLGAPKALRPAPFFFSMIGRVAAQNLPIPVFNTNPLSSVILICLWQREQRIYLRETKIKNRF